MLLNIFIVLFESPDPRTRPVGVCLRFQHGDCDWLDAFRGAQRGQPQPPAALTIPSDSKPIGTRTLSTTSISQGLRATDVEVSHSTAAAAQRASGALAARRCAPRSLRIPMLYPRNHNSLAPSAYITPLCICLSALVCSSVGCSTLHCTLRCAASHCQRVLTAVVIASACAFCPSLCPCPPHPPPQCPRWFPCELSSSPSWPCRP